MAHDDRDGRPLLHPDVAGLGLAAALLAELFMRSHATIEEGHVTVVNSTPPVDVLAHTVLDYLISEVTALPVRTWLSYLARTSYPQVADRMLRAGHVQEVAVRRLFTKSVWLQPTNMNVAAWPTARLSTRIRGRQPLGDVDTILIGLVLATDLHHRVLAQAPAELISDLRRLIATTPPPIRELLWHTEAAVGDAVITGV